MSSQFSVLVVLLAVSFAPLKSWSQTKYVVQPGDTILKVADRNLGSTDRKDPRRYKLAQKIKQMNPGIKDFNSLTPGQTLLIPSTSPTVQSAVVAEPANVSESASVAEDHAASQDASHMKADVTSAPVPAATPVSLPEPTPSVVITTSPTLVGRKHAPVQEAPPFEDHKAQAKPHHSAHENFIFVQPRYQMLKISSKDLATKSTVSMKSKSSFGLDLQYGKILNDSFHLLFQAGLTHTQFDKIEGQGATINHDSETLKSFAVGIAYEATTRLHLDLMFMATERTFVIPTTLPAYELKAVMIPGAELNISFDLYRGDSNIFGISAIGEFLSTVAKDPIEYKSAVESLAALYWKSNYGSDRVNYKATLTYKQGHQDTSLSQQSEDLTALGVGFYF